jgi:pyruvate/2-oxoglutarate dehydrogenase complex dihydrolipoamide dehydrogenase (E3) component
MEANEYELIVIGSGSAGQKGRHLRGAKLRKKVAIIDRKRTIRGVCARMDSTTLLGWVTCHYLAKSQ